MKRALFWGLLSLLILVSLITVSCAKQTTTETKTPVTSQPAQPVTTSPGTTSSPVTGAAHWWDKWGKPKYGGTLNVRTTSIGAGSFDPIAGMGSAGGFATNVWYESLFGPDWTVDREVWPFNVGYLPLEYTTGVLAESWEQKDPTTIIVKLRKGVHWWNKPPVNGRELVADDIVFNYDRILGTGHGYTTPNPFMASQIKDIEKVSAVDNYTLEYKLKSPGAMKLYQVTGGVAVVAPEWVGLAGPPSSEPQGEPGAPPPGPGGPPGGGVVATGPLTDWKTVVGTGPWILTDFTEGNLMAFEKNPNYWGYDERYPENRLPYFDGMKIIAIPDISTAIASLRTGKIDMITDVMGTMTWQQGEMLAKTNPEIQQAILIRPAACLNLRVDNKPFNDIRVRKALQLAIDNESIGKNYYGGHSSGKPVGMLSPYMKGWTLPDEDWPTDVKEEYTYNPDKARQLLSEAGYPKGFKTNVVTFGAQDSSLLQLIKSEFAEIGVDMEIVVYDMGTFMNLVMSGKHDQIAYNDGGIGKPELPVMPYGQLLTSSSQNQTFHGDKNFDAMYDKMLNAATVQEAQKISIEIDMYILKQHWMVHITPYVSPIAWQSYVKGYTGELLNSGQLAGSLRARMWIDKGTK